MIHGILKHGLVIHLGIQDFVMWKLDVDQIKMGTKCLYDIHTDMCN